VVGDGVVDDRLGQQRDGDLGRFHRDGRGDHHGERAAVRAQVMAQPPQGGDRALRRYSGPNWAFSRCHLVFFVGIWCV
jgi:hypothetical protein